MRRATVRLTVACVLLLAASSASPAAAAKPDPSVDGLCGFTSVNDTRPSAPYDGQLAVLDGGPVTQSGTLTCTVKVGGATHAAPYADGATASASGSYGVTVLPTTVAPYVSHRIHSVYLCDGFTDLAGVTWYWDDAASDWTTDEDAPCRLAISHGDGPPPLDPVLADFFEAVAREGEAVRRPAEPLLCAALGALAPGVAPYVDIGADGDTYVAGDLVVGCAPATGEPGDALTAHRVAGLAPAVERYPSRKVGALRVSDTGAGAGWDASGTLESADWRCVADGAGVACQWVGEGYPTPACRAAHAMTAALAAQARARTRGSCVRGTTVESATTRTTSPELPVTFAERGMTALPVTSLRCEVDDGAGGPPVAPYVATCGFTF